MSIQDIIEAAAQEFAAVMGKDAEWSDHIAGAGDNCDPHGGPTDADTFIAHFSPAHVALMEAVCEAAEHWRQYVENADLEISYWGAPISKAVAALAAYRKEQGDE